MKKADNYDYWKNIFIMVMPNNNPKDHYETAKVPWKKIREISKQYYEDKETLRKNNRNWCRGFSQEEKN